MLGSNLTNRLALLEDMLSKDFFKRSKSKTTFIKNLENEVKT